MAKKLTFEDRALKYLRHTLFCKWVSPMGWYDSGKPCTCGRDAFFLEICKMKRTLESTICGECGKTMMECVCADIEDAWRKEIWQAITD